MADISPALNTFFETCWAWLSSHFNFLVLFGLIGQGLFMMRFVAQWVHSEKMGRSAVPDIFWLFSVGGGVVLLIYAILKNDFVFIVGQGFGLIIYARNIFFIYKARKRYKSTSARDVLEALSAQVSSLMAKQDPLSDSQSKAAAEALVILEGRKK